jgi:hypothetical protein
MSNVRDGTSPRSGLREVPFVDSLLESGFYGRLAKTKWTKWN